jgi:hypothetical protein
MQIRGVEVASWVRSGRVRGGEVHFDSMAMQRGILPPLAVGDRSRLLQGDRVSVVYLLPPGPDRDAVAVQVVNHDAQVHWVLEHGIAAVAASALRPPRPASLLLAASLAVLALPWGLPWLWPAAVAYPAWRLLRRTAWRRAWACELEIALTESAAMRPVAPEAGDRPPSAPATLTLAD